ncbi:sensor domain-containing protein [Mycolicibacterium peregrinum]|uniref:Sensor domain-containing protein n=2 Tax=Mycolicibacterium peregrinum TaxID=43304 RepID=A0A4Z0HJW2_MYCPR|nr:sensor domain-containing protein [Mycolicibacterium peregrinum]TGB38249.1 sensor domain-containing protein [Mycolicibacterium peregrinum]
MVRTRVAAFCGLTVLGTGCGTGVPTMPTKATSANSTEATVVSVEEVRSISGVSGFREVPELDATAPSAVPDTPEACLAVFDPPTVLGTGWMRFRATGYATELDTPALPTLADVRQMVAVYPDSATAQATFDRLTSAVPDCTATDTGYYNRSVEKPDPNTLLLNAHEAAGAYDAYRLADTTLISSSALGLPDSERVTLEVLDRLEDAQH